MNKPLLNSFKSLASGAQAIHFTENLLSLIVAL